MTQFWIVVIGSTVMIVALIIGAIIAGRRLEPWESKKKEAEMAANPDGLRPEDLKELDKWRCLTVMVSGKSEPEPDVDTVSKQDAEALFKNGPKAVGQKFTLAEEVRQFMAPWQLTESGYGLGCWDLGCYCTWLEAWNLVEALRVRFSNEITTKRLTIRTCVWSAELK